MPNKAGCGVIIEFELNKIKNQTEPGLFVKPSE